MANKLHRDRLRPAADADAARISRILSKSHEAVGLEESMEGLALWDNSVLSGVSRNTDAEGDFIAYFNNLSLSTILRQRVRGFRTRPLSLAASTMKCVHNLKDIIYDNDGARIMTADTSQLSPVYDLLLDAMGSDPVRFPRWTPAGSREAVFDLGSFGQVSLMGSPDSLYEGAPLELKTVKNSLRAGATREKIREWSMQVAAYQRTHGGGDGTATATAGRAVLLLVSLLDLEVLALNVGPENYANALGSWTAHLSSVFGGLGNRYRKYWDCVVRFRNEDASWRSRHHGRTRRMVRGWQEEDSRREIAEGLALMPRILSEGLGEIAERFSGKISLGRKLCLRGRKVSEARRKDRGARAVLSGIKRDTAELFEAGIRLAIGRWNALKDGVESGGSAEEEELYVRNECKAVLRMLMLMKSVSVWQEKKGESRVIEGAVKEVREKAREWRERGVQFFEVEEGRKKLGEWDATEGDDDESDEGDDEVLYKVS